jgi:hypothetical protein
MNPKTEEIVVTQEDQLDLDPKESGKDVPLELDGYETMQQTFGIGANKRVVLVGKPVTLNQLVALSKSR